MLQANAHSCIKRNKRDYSWRWVRWSVFLLILIVTASHLAFKLTCKLFISCIEEIEHIYEFHILHRKSQKTMSWDTRITHFLDRLTFSTYTSRLRSTPGAVLLAHACCWSHEHIGGTAAKCHLGLEDETAPFLVSFGRCARVSTKLGCRGRNIEHSWRFKWVAKKMQIQILDVLLQQPLWRDTRTCCTVPPMHLNIDALLQRFSTFWNLRQTFHCQRNIQKPLSQINKRITNRISPHSTVCFHLSIPACHYGSTFNVFIFPSQHTLGL